MPLPVFHYDTESIRIEPLSRDEKALEAIRLRSKDVVPKKVLDVYGEVCFPGGFVDRPYTMASIVLSADGKMAYSDVPQGPVIASTNRLDENGGRTDFWVLNMLRSYCDGVIMGARTMQTEPDATAHIFCEELAAARMTVLKKKTPNPLNIAVSFDGTDVPLGHKVFGSDELQAVIATSEAGLCYLAENMGSRAHVLFGPYASATDGDAAAIRQSIEQNPNCIHVIATGKGDKPDTMVLMKILRKMGLERLCIESPSYMLHLMEKRALDEFFINYSMVFAGGGISPGQNSPFTSTNHPHSELLMVGRHGYNFLFTRQHLRYDYL